jgi:hypothetical protein
MSDMVHAGTARLLATTHSECAICGEQPPARLEAAQAVKAWGLGSEAWADRILHPDQELKLIT